MLVDGKAIADSIKAKLKSEIGKLDETPSLALIVVGEDFATSRFVRAKKRVADEVGMGVVLSEFSEDVSQAELEAEVDKFANDKSISGIVVQLPLPESIDAEEVLKHIPASKDVDSLTGSGEMLSPVVLAIKEILDRNEVEVFGKNVLVIGRGKLVGAPSSSWFKKNGATVTVADVDTKNLGELTKDADIIVSGAGVPDLIKPDMITEGVILLDAGASETSGELKGDAKKACADKCSVFTPVPGGIGPITVAMLFSNVVEVGSYH